MPASWILEKRKKSNPLVGSGGFRKCLKSRVGLPTDQVGLPTVQVGLQTDQVGLPTVQVGDKGDFLGFDVVIGNPPYVRQELLGDLKTYYRSHYKVYHGMADLYSYFVEKGIGLLHDQGVFGVIVANKWMRANYGEPLR